MSIVIEDPSDRSPTQYFDEKQFKNLDQQSYQLLLPETMYNLRDFAKIYFNEFEMKRDCFKKDFPYTLEICSRLFPDIPLVTDISDTYEFKGPLVVRTADVSLSYYYLVHTANYGYMQTIHFSNQIVLSYSTKDNVVQLKSKNVRWTTVKNVKNKNVYVVQLDTEPLFEETADWQYSPTFLTPLEKTTPIQISKYPMGFFRTKPLATADMKQLVENNYKWFAQENNTYYAVCPACAFQSTYDMEVGMPTRECLESQVAYIFQNEMRFLLVVAYCHAEQEMLRHGRATERLDRDPNAKSILAMTEQYRLDLRCNDFALRAFAAMDPLQQYRALQETIINAPKCNEALLLYRGQETMVPWDENPLDSIIVSNSILSTSFDLEVGRHFAQISVLITYHIPKGMPYLFVNTIESEILLPAGLIMKLESIESSEPIRVVVKVLGFQPVSMSKPAKRKRDVLD